MAKAEKSNLKQALFTVSDAILGAAILLVVGVYFGSWLDDKCKTAPLFSISLALIGGALGLARMVAKAAALDKPSKNDVPEKKLDEQN